MINNLTMVIPTRNRHAYLERAISYYNDAPFRLIITDSSNDQYSGKIYKNIKYIHTEDGFFNKIKNAIDSVKTDYVALCGDDDFDSYAGLEQCIRYLNENKDYIAVQGRCCAFKLENENIKRSALYIHALNLNASSDDIIKRISQIMECYIPFLYSVIRTSSIKRIFKMMSTYSIVEPVLVELGMVFGAAILGKLRVLPVFYSMREKIAQSGGKNYRNMVELCTNVECAEEYGRFKEMLSFILNQEIECNMKDSNAIIDYGLSLYFNEFMDMRSKLLSRSSRILNIVKGVFKMKNIRAVLATPLKEIEDLDFFFRVVNEKGYPFPWDVESYNDWRIMEKVIRSYKSN